MHFYKNLSFSPSNQCGKLRCCQTFYYKRAVWDPTYYLDPLIIAIEANQLEIVRFLVKTKADLDKNASPESNRGLNTTTLIEIALGCAAEKGHIEILRYLVEQGADKDRPVNRFRATALIFAAERGHFGMVEFLLEDGSDVNKVDQNSETALHVAALCGHAEILSLLMAYGASLTARGNHGRLPIDVARNETIRVLILDEPSRRMDHGYKRAVIPDPDAEQASNHPHAVGEDESSASTAAVKTAEELKFEEEVNEDSASSDEDEI